MRRQLLLLLVCCTASAQTAVRSFTKALGEGDAALALRFGSETEERCAKAPWITAMVADAVHRFAVGKGTHKSQVANTGKLLALMVRTGERLAKEDRASADRVLWQAETRLMEARWKASTGDEKWLVAWRAAARILLDFEGEGAGRLRARAAEMLCTAANVKGAPAAELLAEAHSVDADPDSAASLAAQLGTARHHLTAKRRREAQTALEKFAGLRDKLDANDLDRVSVYNDAVCFGRESRLAPGLEFIMAPQDTSSLRFAIPRSHRWSISDKDIVQRTPEGFVRREITILNIPEHVPSSSATARSSNPKARAKGFMPGLLGDFEKVKRKIGPKSLRFSKSLRGTHITAKGFLGDGSFATKTYFFFRGRRLKKSWGLITIRAHGDDPDDDADFDAFLKSFVDG